jgi:hypothetical protein
LTVIKTMPPTIRTIFLENIKLRSLLSLHGDIQICGIS